MCKLRYGWFLVNYRSDPSARLLGSLVALESSKVVGVRFTSYQSVAMAGMLKTTASKDQGITPASKGSMEGQHQRAAAASSSMIRPDRPTLGAVDCSQGIHNISMPWFAIGSQASCLPQAVRLKRELLLFLLH